MKTIVLTTALLTSTLLLSAETITVSLTAPQLNQEKVESYNDPLIIPSMSRLELAQKQGPNLTNTIIIDDPVTRLITGHLHNVEKGFQATLEVGEGAERQSSTITIGPDDILKWKTLGDLRIQFAPGNPPKFIRYWTNPMRQGTVELPNGEQMQIGLVDKDGNGRFDEDNTQLLLDLDKDEKFKTKVSSNEIYSLNQKLSFSGGSWEFSASPDGSTLEMIPVPTSETKQLSILAIGKPAPGWTAQNFDGEEVTLASLHGKFVFLDVWATWCGPCVGEMPNIQEASVHYADQPIEFVSISIDNSMDTAKKFIEEKEYTWTNLWTPGAWGSELNKAYEIRGIPSTFLVDPEGILIATNIRGEAIDKTMAMISKYDTPEGKKYFKQKAEYSKLVKHLSNLMEEGKLETALKEVNAALESRDDKDAEEPSEETKSLTRYKSWIETKMED